MREAVRKLIFIRHGKAEPKTVYVDDTQRKLTSTGRNELNKILPE